MEYTFRGSFQSTPLCEGRPEDESDYDASREFQSTPLCEGRHDILRLIRLRGVVSIHAPL